MKKLYGKVFIIVLAFLMLTVVLSGCKSMFDNIKGKSYNVALSGLGGKFTTAIDPSTGTPCPSMDIGSIDSSIMSHVPGDGTQVSFVTQKSFWGPEVGSQTCKINCKSGVKSMLITSMAKGQTIVYFEEYDTTDKTAKKFSSELAAVVGKNSAKTNAKIKAMLAKIRKSDAANPKTKERFTKLSAMPDAELFIQKPSDDLIDNRLIGNEVLWRVINKSNAVNKKLPAATIPEVNSNAPKDLTINMLQEKGFNKKLCIERGFRSQKEPIADANVKV